MAVFYMVNGKQALKKGVEYGPNPEKCEELLEKLDYAGNPIKTEMRYVSGVNCSSDVDIAFKEMTLVKEQFGKTDKRIYYHAWQSFHPDEKVSADEVHRIGVEFAERVFSNFQVMVSTHIEKNHLHNHFVINSVSFVDGKKFHLPKGGEWNLRKVNDEICRGHGLTTIQDKRYRGKSYKDWLDGKRDNYTLRDLIKEDVDMAILNSVSMSEFFSELENLGYEVKRGKHMAVSAPGRTNSNGNRGYIRLRSLNDPRYTEQGIEARIRENYRNNFGFSFSKRHFSNRKKVRKKGKLPYYQALYYKYMFMIGGFKKRPRQSAAAMRKSASELKKYEKQIRFIKDNNIKNKSDLDQFYNNIFDKYTKAEGMRTQLRNQIRRKDDNTDRRDITSLSEQLSKLRGELKLIEQIKVKTKEIETTYGEIRAAKKGEENVFRDASSGRVREPDRTGDNPSNKANRNGNRNDRKATL